MKKSSQIDPADSRDLFRASILFTIGLPVWVAGVLLSLTSAIPILLYALRILPGISSFKYAPGLLLFEAGSAIQLGGFIYLWRYTKVASSTDVILKSLKNIVGVGFAGGLLTSILVVTLPIAIILFSVGYIGLGAFLLRQYKATNRVELYGASIIFPLSVATMFTLSIVGWILLLSASAPEISHGETS
jgi:hypothetical protein